MWLAWLWRCSHDCGAASGRAKADGIECVTATSHNMYMLTSFAIGAMLEAWEDA
jgi:hypothetical protein